MSNSETYLADLATMDQQMLARFDREYVECNQAFEAAFAHLAWTVTHAQIPKRRRHIAAAVLTSRILQHAHAAWDLIRKGNAPSAEVLMRSMLESVFAVAALARDENFEQGRDMFLSLRYKAVYSAVRDAKKLLASTMLDATSRKETYAHHLVTDAICGHLK